MYDERQLKGELSKLFAILASCINYQLVPGASIVEQCWATVIIIAKCVLIASIWFSIIIITIATVIRILIIDL